MTKKKEKKTEKKEEVKIEGIFSGVGKMISSLLNLTDKMMKEGKEIAEKKGEIEGKIGGKPTRISYGYRVGIGLRPGAKAREEEFKPYVIKKAAGEKIEGKEEPNTMLIWERIPPVERKDIKIYPKGRRLVIEIKGKRYKEISLPFYVKRVEAKYEKGKKEGTLTIKVEKR